MSSRGTSSRVAGILYSLLLACIFLTAAGCAATDPLPVKRPDTNRATQSPVSASFAGSASCAGRSCHGTLEPTFRELSWQTEFTRWTSEDVHTQAYRALDSELARSIMERLGGKEKDAREATQCLGCHVTPQAALNVEDPETMAFIRRERSYGVGCESCHGNATKWLDEHVSEKWRGLSEGEKSNTYGMRPLSIPFWLAQTCGQCHVGSEGSPDLPFTREVNHDLIAAGHPRLAFEASSFLANLPEHWRHKAKNEAEIWFDGQVASRFLSLKLLKSRAENVDAPWPEFAEYDCFSCHQGVSGPRVPVGGPTAGSLKWGSWYFATMRGEIVEARSDENGADWDSLKTAMQKAHPERTTVAVAINNKILASSLGPFTHANGWFEQSLIAKLLAVDQRDDSWEAAEQRYLALQALNASLGEQKDRGLQARLDRLQPIRAFPAGWGSPRSGPKGFVPQQFVEMLRTVDP